jgi:hypothetical protein
MPKLLCHLSIEVMEAPKAYLLILGGRDSQRVQAILAPASKKNFPGFDP